MDSRRRLRSRRIAAVFMVLVFMTSGLATLAMATHANELFPDLRELLGGTPSTGLSSVDDQVGEAFDEYETLRAEPQVPANYFYSSAGTDLRIGGHGAWTFLLGTGQLSFQVPVGRDDWDESPAYSAVGDYSYSFGNEANGEYRRETLNAYYVSPMVDLSAFVVTTGDETVGTIDPVSQVGSGAESGQTAVLANRVAQAEQIKLRFQHKFNLAFANDGARVEVFTTQPAPGGLITPDEVLMPSLVDVSTAPMQPARAYDGSSESSNLAFTGQQGQWQTAEFDLTAYAGQQVFLAFRVATRVSAAEQEAYFETAQYFPPSNPLDFFGWKVDAVQIEGPAHHTNIRVRAIEEPAYVDPGSGQILAPAGPGPSRGQQVEFTAQIENRGSVTEDGYDVLFEVNGPDGLVDCENSGQTTGPRLRPGAHTSITVACAMLTAEAGYTLAVSVVTSRTVPDGDHGDNELRLSFLARSIRHLALETPLQVSPVIGEPQDVRTVKLHAKNAGNDELLLDVQLTVLDSSGDEATLPPFDQPQPGILLDVGDELEWDWDILLPLAGTYGLHVEATAAGALVFERTLKASTLVGSGNVYFDDHTGTPQGAIVGSSDWLQFDGWTPNPSSATDGAYWDLAADEDDSPAVAASAVRSYAEQGRVAYLAGSPEIGSELVGESFDELVVTVRHQINARCGGGWSGVLSPAATLCRVADVGNPNSGAQPETSSTARPTRDGLGTYEFWVTVPHLNVDGGQVNIIADVGTANVNATDVMLQKVRSVGPVRDHVRFYAFQWVEEEYRLTATDIHPQLTTIPGSLVAALQLEARAAYGACYYRYDSQTRLSEPHDGCPNWWIDELAIDAVKRGSQDVAIRVLDTSGVPETETGDWTSSMRRSPSRVAVQGEVPTCPRLGEGEPDPASTAEQAAFACPVWARRSAEPAPLEQWSIHDEPFLTGSPAWWVGPTQDDISFPAHFQYPRESANVLVSPTLEVPPGLDDASLQFFHKFALREAGAHEPDYGAVFVQFMSDGDPKPLGPFYQLVLQDGVFERNGVADPNTAASPPQDQAFQGDSCDWYSLPASSCSNALEQRGLHLETIPLEPIRFLNYSAVNARTAKLNNDWVDDGESIQSVDSWRFDIIAYENGAKSLKETGGRVRFAFVHYAGNSAPTGVADGWFIGPVTVTGDNTPAHDVSIETLDLKVPYAADEVGLGPGTTVDFSVRLANNGLFSQRNIEIEAVVTNADSLLAVTSTFQTPEGFVLKPGEETEIDLPVSLPDTEGAYHIMVTTSLVGRADDRPGNNCWDFDTSGLQSGHNALCNPTQSPPAVVRRHVDVGIQASIVPIAGRVDDPPRGIFFPRQTFVEISNSGNVPVQGLEVRRAIQKVVPPDRLEPAGGRTWILPDPIQPGERSAFENLTRILESGNPNEDDLTLSFHDPARYLVAFDVVHPEDGVLGDNTARQLVEAWEIFYSNNFEPGGEDRTLFTYDDWTTGGEEGDAWHQSQAASFVDSLGRGSTSFWYGDPVKGEYPGNASAWLEMPKMDFSNASLAFLNFRTRYDFEPVYDGGLVEASVDGGSTWFPLRPDPLPPFLPRGYAQSLASSNPMNTASDPTEAIDAYTGDSRGIVAGTEWIPATIDLGKAIEEFRNELIVESFHQTAFQDEATRIDSDDPTERSRTHHSWQVEGQPCPRCWVAENVAHARPALAADDGNPLFAGYDDFWWSGLRGPGQRTLELNLTHEDARFDSDISQYQVWLTWWQWGTGTTPNLQPVETRGDWVRMETEITSEYVTAGTGVPVDYRWAISPNQGSVRGWALTSPALHAYEIGGGGRRILADTHPIDLHDSSVWTSNGWTTEDLLVAPQVWGIAEEETRLGKQEEVWVFRNRTANVNALHDTVPYADDRLVTPLIDLTGVTGESAELRFWQKGRALPGDMTRLVEAQVLDRFSVPPEWGAWEPIFATAANFDVADWEQAGPITLGDDFIGQQIRLGFRGITNQDILVGNNQNPYNGWWIDDVEVRGETMVGGPLRIRFHAGSDDSVSSSGWGIDNIEIVGRSYTENVALDLEDLSAREVSPGDSLWFNGTIRNLSPRIWVNVGVRAVADLPDGEHSLTAVEPGSLVNPDFDGVVGGLNLLAAGSVGSDGITKADRVPFAFRFDVPETYDDDGNPVSLEETDFKVRIEAMQFNGNELVSIRDENLGDHGATIDISAVIDDLLEIDGVDMTIRDPAVDETTTVSMSLANSGTRPASTDVSLFIRDVHREDEVQLDVKSVFLEAGATGELEWDWTPEQPGIYAIEYTNVPSYVQEGASVEREAGPGIEYAFVGQSLMYFYDSLDDLTQVPRYDFDPGIWSSEPGPGAVRACNRDVPTAGRTEWGPSSRAVIGERSLVTAVDDAEFWGEGQTYAGNMDDRLYQPLVDLGPLVDGGRSGTPRVLDQVFLNFWYRPLVEPGNDGLTVVAQSYDPTDESFSGLVALTPEDTSLWEQPPCDNPIRAVSSGMLTGQSDTWFRANFDLGDDRLLGEQVRPSYRFGSDTETNLQGIFIDSVSVSGYNARTEPAAQAFTLTDASTKSFHVKITNQAPVRDRFSVEIDSSSTEFPPNVGTIDVITPELSLEPGASGVAEIRVTTPLNRTLRTDGPFNITLLAVSEGDPNRAAVARIDFDVFAPRLWPDLEAKLKVGTPDGTGTEGEPLSYLATISNFGLATSDLVPYQIYACPVDPEASGSACKVSDENLIDEGDLSPIRPFVQTGRTDLSRATITGTWTPPVGGAGDYVLVLVADPRHEATDYDRANDRFELPLTVTELKLPDLKIEADMFRIETPNGREIDDALQGQPVRFRVTVENVGNAPAPGIKVRINSQFTLTAQEISNLDPGDRVEVVANWVTLPGTWIVKAEATTSKPEFSLENNAVAKKLVVQRSDFAMSVDAGESRGIAGDAWEFPVEVSNTGEAPIQVAVRARTPAGFRADVTPGQLTLDLFESGSGVVRVTSDEAIPPGRYQVLIQANTVGVDLPPATSAQEIVIESQSRAAVAGNAFLNADDAGPIAAIPVANKGTEAFTARPTVDAPPGWKVTPRPPQAVVNPGETTNFTIDVEIPKSYRPGEYPVDISFSLPSGTESTTLVVLVPAIAEFDAQVMRDAVIGTNTRAITLRLENAGNAVGTPSLALVGEATQLRMEVDPSLAAMPPGTATLHSVTITGVGAWPANYVLHANGKPVTSAPSTTTPGVTGPDGLDLRVADLLISPRGDVKPGELVTISTTLENHGSTAIPGVPAALYVDGILVDETLVAPDPGMTQRAAFQWRATSGIHVLTVVIDPFDELAEDRRDNNLVTVTLAPAVESAATPALVIPSPGLALSFAVLVIAVLVVRRRSRNAF